MATGEAGPVGFIGDYPVPIVGRVSMDFITVDVTDVPPELTRRGAWVEVMGDRVTVDDLTDRAGTIGYELLPASARASIASTSNRRPESHGQDRPQHLRLPELRGGGTALDGQVRLLRRVEHASSRKPTAAPVPGSGLSKSSKGRVVVLETLTHAGDDKIARLPTGLAELDRVTGGGIVPGSALLIGGEPGIGKSTLLLQLAAAFASAGRRAVYFTGEEAAAQVRLRAERLGLAKAPLALASETNVSNILATLADGPRADLVVIDSIQTLWADAPGGGARHRQPGARRHAVADALRQGAGQRAACSSATSPRTARSPAPR